LLELISSCVGSQFPKWTGALDRYEREASSNCSAAADPRAAALGKGVRWSYEQEPAPQLAAASRYGIRRHRYAAVRRHGYWATPRQFLGRSGDCEDYARVKYSWRVKSMRVLVLNDASGARHDRAPRRPIQLQPQASRVATELDIGQHQRCLCAHPAVGGTSEHWPERAL